MLWTNAECFFCLSEPRGLSKRVVLGHLRSGFRGFGVGHALPTKKVTKLFEWQLKRTHMELVSILHLNA